MSGSVPYERVQDDPVWRAGVDGLAWEEMKVDGTVLWYSKNGACPHCGHPDGIRVTVEAEGVIGVRANQTTASTDVYVVCQCHGDETRPSGVGTGCGYSGYVTGPLSE
jgi:hypothetical protein